MSKSRPKKGSRGYKRVRSQSTIAKLRYERSVIQTNAPMFENYVAVKAGMTHITEVKKVPIKPKSSTLKDVEYVRPVTILEIPKIKIEAIRAYKSTETGDRVIGDYTSSQDIPNDTEYIRVLASVDNSSIKSLPSKKKNKIDTLRQAMLG